MNTANTEREPHPPPTASTSQQRRRATRIRSGPSLHPLVFCEQLVSDDSGVIGDRPPAPGTIPRVAYHDQEWVHIWSRIASHTSDGDAPTVASNHGDLRSDDPSESSHRGQVMFATADVAAQELIGGKDEGRPPSAAASPLTSNRMSHRRLAPKA